MITLFAVGYLFRLSGNGNGDSSNLFHAGGILVAALSGACCSLVGCYLVLQRMSLLGDAISHAALPGIAIAYLFTHQLGGWPMVAGAFALGVAMAMLAQTLHGVGKLPEDVSIGVVYTALFALGVILVTAQTGVHLDVQCALFGALEYVALDLVAIGGFEVPRASLTLGALLVAISSFLALFWKELKLVAFDAALARAMGLPALLLHFGLMGLVAGAAVASFEAVGSILVVAMLIVPAATAQLICDRFAEMLAWAVALSCGAALLGYAGALEWHTSAAGMMSVVAGGQLVIALLAAPRHGVLSRALRNLGLALRIAREDILGRLYRQEEGEAPQTEQTHPASLRQRWIATLARWQLIRSHWIFQPAPNNWRLTPAGRDAAQSLVRAHRLWEAYLETHFDLPVDHLHEAAERMEHFLDPELQQELNAELAGRTHDPHGRSIPETAPPQW
jgi:ABC-type Mn2+/Zn2+ transport system permease subunit